MRENFKGYVTLATINGTFPVALDFSCRPIFKSVAATHLEIQGTHEWNLRVPNLQLSCSGLTTMTANQDSNPSSGCIWHTPLLAISAVQGYCEIVYWHDDVIPRELLWDPLTTIAQQGGCQFRVALHRTLCVKLQLNKHSQNWGGSVGVFLKLHSLTSPLSMILLLKKVH